MPVSRPKNEEELQKLEAVGVIRASRFVRRYAQSHKEITVATICAIHKEIFEDAWAEIAGGYRDENLLITDSDLLLPHYSQVPEMMEKLDTDLIDRIDNLKDCEGHILDLRTEVTHEAVACI